jgi:hypothetical protein
MGNVQGRLHRRKSKRSSKRTKSLKDTVQSDKMIFIDREDGIYAWENHEYGRLPFNEPEDCEIVFYGDKLWQDDSDKWSLVVLLSDDDDDGYFADDESKS